MPVISRSHVELVRARKALRQAFEEQDWEQLRERDIELGLRLDRAFDDKDSDSKALVKEMERILNTYAELVEVLPDYAENLSFVPRPQM
jgi:hypothetical protein